MRRNDWHYGFLRSGLCLIWGFVDRTLARSVMWVIRGFYLLPRLYRYFKR